MRHSGTRELNWKWWSRSLAKFQILPPARGFKSKPTEIPLDVTNSKHPALQARHNHSHSHKGLMTCRSPVAPTHNIQKFSSTQIFGGNQTQYLTGWPNAFTLTFEVNSQNRWMTTSPQYTQQKQSHEFQLWGAQSFIAYTNSLKWGGEKPSTVSFCIN